MTKTITVKGVGNVSVKPDLIVVSMKLATEDREYDKTMELAAQRISLINDSLETIGFEKNSVKTTDFNVRTNYESVKDKSGNYKSVFKGYVCNHKLKVEFDFDKSERNARSVGRPNGWSNTRLLGISWVDGKFQDEEKIV